MGINRIKGEGDDLVDVEELVGYDDNLDGKKGLVTNALIHGRLDNSSVATVPASCGAFADGQSNYGYGLRIQSRLFAFNGTTWDGWKNNLEGTLLASAARTVTTYSTDQTNYNHKGTYLFVNVTAIGAAPSITVRLSMKDSISGLYSAISAISAPITAVGTYVIALHPALIDTAGTFHLACDALLPRTWRLRIAHANTDSITYSISYQSIV